MLKNLTREEFLAVVENTPLVSIDLVVRDRQNRVLMGLRVNEPARGLWFVPGGRITKGETLDQAFSRISTKELGIPTSRGDARLLGVFTHQYDSNFAGVPGITTHYVVLAYELHLSLDLKRLPQDQHSDYKWWSSSEVANSEVVHANNVPYFLPSGSEGFPSKSALWVAQYEALNNRRNSFNQLLWQAPALSLTAQAFLFSIVFSKEVRWEDQMIAATLAFVTAVASVQLLAKHRTSEMETAIQAEEMERSACITVLNAKKDARLQPWYARYSSYELWVCLLTIFGATALMILLKGLLPEFLKRI